MNSEVTTGAIDITKLPVTKPPPREKTPTPPSLITERKSKKGRISTVLTDYGKTHIKEEFHKEYVLKSADDPYGQLNKEVFDRKIAELKATFQNTKAKERTADQKFNYLTVRSLEMHRRRLVDAEIMGAMTASNSSWQDIAQRMHTIVKTADGNKPRYSQKYILNALKPVAKEIFAQAEIISPEDGLTRQYLADLVAERLKSASYNLAPLIVKDKVNFSHLIYQTLGGNTSEISGLSKKDLMAKLTEKLRLETIKNRALAQAEMYLGETAAAPTFKESEILRLMRGLTGDPQYQGERLIQELVSGNISREDFEADPYSFLNQLSSETQNYITNHLKSFATQPIATSFGLSHEQTKKVVEENREKMRHAQTPKDVMWDLYNFNIQMGMDKESATVTLFDEPWITSELKEEFVQELGYTPEQATLDLATEKLTKGQRKKFKRFLQEYFYGSPVRNLEVFQDIVKNSENRNTRKIGQRLREVMSADYLKNWGDKWMRVLNGTRIAINLYGISDGLWIESQLRQSELKTIKHKQVGVDFDNDGFADKYTTAADAVNYTQKDGSGESTVHLDLDGDGIIDAIIATPTINQNSSTNPSFPTGSDAQQVALEKPLEESTQTQSTPETETHPASAFQLQLEEATWLNQVDTAIQKQEEEPLTLKSVLAPVFNTLIKGRIDNCNENKDWCDVVLGENAVKFPGVVIWFVGIDQNEVGTEQNKIPSLGDAIHGIAVNADTGEITFMNINRDTRAPGMAGDPGGTINKAWSVDQQVLAADNRIKYDPERGQRILSEATGVYADVVVEVSLNGLEEMVRLFYGISDNETVPVTVSEEEEFYPHTEELQEFAGPDGKIESGTINLNPRQLMIYLRERKGTSEGTFSREARQSDFISQILQDAISRDPANLIRILKDLPSVLEKMENNKNWARVTTNLPSELDADRDGRVEMHEFANEVQPTILKSLQDTVLYHPIQFVNMLKNLSEHLKNRNYIVPTKDENNKAQLHSDGQKMIMTENEEGNWEDNYNLVHTPNPTDQQKVTYWQRFRDWSRKTVLGKK